MRTGTISFPIAIVLLAAAVIVGLCDWISLHTRYGGDRAAQAKARWRLR